MGKHARKFFLVVAILFTVLLVGFVTARVYKSVSFYVDCSSHINKATYANDVETAKNELIKAIDYIEKKNLTEGNTSLFFKNTRNDIGILYGTLKSVHKELESFSENATQLEKSNFLIGIREILLKVRIPNGISIYPNNDFYAFWFLVSILGTVLYYKIYYDETH